MNAVADANGQAGQAGQAGQVFADLLFLAAMSCRAPMAMISVAQADGSWSTLSYGVDRTEPPCDPELFAAVAEGSHPVEVTDAVADPRLAASVLTAPLGVRYFYGIPLPSPDPASVAVLCVLDRRTRELTRREQQAVAAVGRQLTGQLVLWRRPRKAVSPADHVGGPSGWGQPGAAAVGSPVTRLPSSGREQHLLRSHEVALLFDVTGRTVVNWASSKKLASLRTAGGHLRFRSEDVLALLAARSPASSDEVSPGG
jgi:excisionase family DNA binding protein